MRYLSTKDRDDVIKEIYEVVAETADFYIIKLLWCAERQAQPSKEPLEMVPKNVPHIISRYQIHESI